MSPPNESSGSETILVVDDEKSVLSITSAFLARGGFDILQAVSGEQALEICEKKGSDICLLLTDVVMPKMTGPQLAEHLLPLYPKMRVAYMTGGYGDCQLENALPFSFKRLLRKPFTPNALIAFVRDVLDEPQKREPGRQPSNSELRKNRR
jgi:two-component system cell cycle sensor histidine kinase/response regulator CckA